MKASEYNFPDYPMFQYVPEWKIEYDCVQDIDGFITNIAKKCNIQTNEIILIEPTLCCVKATEPTNINKLYYFKQNTEHIIKQNTIPKKFDKYKERVKQTIFADYDTIKNKKFNELVVVCLFNFKATYEEKFEFVTEFSKFNKAIFITNEQYNIDTITQIYNENNITIYTSICNNNC